MANNYFLDNTFQDLGNLAFYDGWHPNYFYFNTLSSFLVTHKNGWTPSPGAISIAQQAKADAQAQMHIGGRNEQEAIQEMENRFLQITMMLTSAYNYELNNEMDYFKQKYDELTKLFTPDEIASIKPLSELLEMFKPASGSGMLSQSLTSIDYNKFITLINIILQGVDNTKAVAKYEAKRIEDLNKTMQQLLESRGAQAAGIKKRDKLDTLAQSEAAIRAEARLKKEWETEYMLNHRLTQTSKKLVKRRMKNQETGKMETRQIEAEVYNIFGGATFEREVQETVDTVIARWATQTISQIIKDQAMIRKLTQYLQANYTKVHTFHELEDEIQQKIILAVQEYGMENLENLLVNQTMRKIGKKGAKEVVNKIIENSNIFNTVSSYDINSSILDKNRYGQKGKRLKLFEGIDNAGQLWQQSSEKLYDAMSEFISILDNKNTELTVEQSTLKTVLSQPGAHYLQRHKDMNHLIKRLQRLQLEVDKKQKAYEKQLIKLAEDDEGHQTNKLDTEGFSIDPDDDIQVDFIVVNGKVTINMGQLSEALRSNSDFERFGFKKFNPQSLNTAIASLKRRASQKLQRDLEYGIQIALNNKQFKLTPQQLFNRVKQGLQNLKVSVTGPTVSEFAAGIHFRQSGGDLIIDWAGSVNGKNDMITITVRANDVAKSIDLSGVSDAVLKKITNTFVPKLEQARKDFLNEWNNQIETTVKKNTWGNHKDKYSIVGSAFIKKISNKELETWNKDLAAKYKKMAIIWERYKDALKSAGVDDDKIESLRHHYLNTLAESFYVSTTVKTFKTYQNDLGFVGGRLGANLDEQLSRIADIFQSAGLPIDDLEWLKFAIINCSPLSIMNTSNKNLIENYLGSLMAFALFDEGSAEGRIVNQFINQINKSKNVTSSQASILHLYKVNGIYVPGSYVLQKVLNSIQHEILPSLENIPQVLTQGAGVRIINKASSSFIPNRPISQYLHNTDGLDTNAWSTTGKAVEDTIELKILFLAGLLDIVNSINKEMSNIEFPT